MSEFSRHLEAAKQGDREALAVLYERYAGPILGAIRKRLYQPLRRQFDSMDLAQSVFAEVIRDLPRVQDLGEPAFRHWLYVKVESNVGMKLRKHLGRHGQRKQRRLETGDPLPAEVRSPPSNIAHDEEMEHAQGLVASLDEEHRTLVLLRLEDGLSFAAIAKRLDLPSADAARMRYARCLAKMRKAYRTTPE